MPREIYTLASSKIRLQGGSFAGEGRVEVYRDGAWNSICGISWDLSDASVICRELGYFNAVEAVVGGKRFKPSSGPIWKTRMLCRGNEDSLLGCQNDDNIAYEGHCSQASQAGVICSKRKNL